MPWQPLRSTLELLRILVVLDLAQAAKQTQTLSQSLQGLSQPIRAGSGEEMVRGSDLICAQCHGPNWGIEKEGTKQITACSDTDPPAPSSAHPLMSSVRNVPQGPPERAPSQGIITAVILRRHKTGYPMEKYLC